MNIENLSQNDLYVGREQTLIKHQILRRYLRRFAHIIGFKWDAITYVDCFSGPWNVQSENLQDSSFSIALQELETARIQHGMRKKSVKIRALFLEKNPDSYTRLEAFAASVKNATVKTYNCEMKEAIQDILDFINRGGTKSFPFIFIDPTGWTGFAMDEIAPLLRISPGEVLINFMTSHITRFLDSPKEETQESFIKLFGSAHFKEKLIGLERRDREDAAVSEYANQVAITGKFRYTAQAIVLHPENDRTHFHLIYATRSPKGLEVFKDAEKKAMTEMQKLRAEAQQRKKEKKTNQQGLFAADDFQSQTYFESLRNRYTSKAKNSIQELLKNNVQTPYDHAWAVALKEPLVWESDLKEWIKDWKSQNWISIQGLKESHRVPHYGEDHILIRQQEAQF